MANRTDEDEAQAERMDQWIVWETEERSLRGDNLTPFLTAIHCIMGRPILRVMRTAQCWGRNIFFVLRAFPGACGLYISLREEKGPKQKCDSNQIKSKIKCVNISVGCGNISTGVCGYNRP